MHRQSSAGDSMSRGLHGKGLVQGGDNAQPATTAGTADTRIFFPLPASIPTEIGSILTSFLNVSQRIYKGGPEGISGHINRGNRPVMRRQNMGSANPHGPSAGRARAPVYGPERAKAGAFS